MATFGARMVTRVRASSIGFSAHRGSSIGCGAVRVGAQRRCVHCCAESYNVRYVNLRECTQFPGYAYVPQVPTCRTAAQSASPADSSAAGVERPPRRETTPGASRWISPRHAPARGCSSHVAHDAAWRAAGGRQPCVRRALRLLRRSVHDIRDEVSMRNAQ